MATEQSASFRLRNGAEILGGLYRKGLRCASGWSRLCACPTKTPFCLAKARWIEISRDADDRLFEVASDDPWWVINVMTQADLAASGLTVSMQVFGLYDIRVGPNGNVPVDQFFQLGEDPQLARAAFMVVNKADAKIHSVEGK